MSIENGRPFNHYDCPVCGEVTITKHEQDGVTPFGLRCRATPGCQGMARSGFYAGSQDGGQVPHVLWIRPEPGDALERVLRSEPRRFRAAMREHYDNGGCLLADAPRADTETKGEDSTT